MEVITYQTYSCVLGEGSKIEHSMALNTMYLILVKCYIISCRHNKCVLSLASLARIFKSKVTSVSTSLSYTTIIP